MQVKDKYILIQKMGHSKEEGGQPVVVVSAGLTRQGTGCRSEWGNTNNTKNLLSFPTGVEVSQEHITIQAQIRDEKVPLPLCCICGGVRRAQGKGEGGRRWEEVSPAGGCICLSKVAMRGRSDICSLSF